MYLGYSNFYRDEFTNTVKIKEPNQTGIILIKTLREPWPHYSYNSGDHIAEDHIHTDITAYNIGDPQQ